MTSRSRRSLARALRRAVYAWRGRSSAEWSSARRLDMPWPGPRHSDRVGGRRESLAARGGRAAAPDPTAGSRSEAEIRLLLALLRGQ